MNRSAISDLIESLIPVESVVVRNELSELEIDYYALLQPLVIAVSAICVHASSSSHSRLSLYSLSLPYHFRFLMVYLSIYSLIPRGTCLNNRYRILQGMYVLYMLTNLMLYANVGISLFIGWSLLSRLAMMSFSLEGKQYWLLKSAPVTTAKLITGKYLVVYIPTLILCWVFLLITSYLQQVSVGTLAYSLAAVALTVAGIAGVNLAFGIVGANFEWEDPRRFVVGVCGPSLIEPADRPRNDIFLAAAVPSETEEREKSVLAEIISAYPVDERPGEPVLAVVLLLFLNVLEERPDKRISLAGGGTFSRAD